MEKATIYPGSIKLHSERLAEAPKRAASLARAVNEALGRAKTHVDPNLTEQGLAAKRAEMMAQFRAAAAHDLEVLRAEVATSRDYLATAAAGSRPVIGGEVVDLVRAQQKWDQARIQLEAGATIGDVLARSDLQTVLAIEEFSPSWIAARAIHAPNFTEAMSKAMHPATGIEESTQSRYASDAVHRRLVALSDPDVGYAMTAARDTLAPAEAAAQWHAAAHTLTEGGTVDLLDVAVGAHLLSAPSGTVEDATEQAAEPGMSADAAA